jgi:predicted metal-dependent phosphoesterase TrpH
MEGSFDSHVSLREIVAKAKERGLDGMCITDHDSLNARDEARIVAKETNFLILVGCEILTYEGDIVVFGLDEVPKEKMYAQELLDLVKKHNGVGISAHPFRENNRGMGNNIKIVKGLSGIEGFNGNTKNYNNLRACALAMEINLPMFGASDCHWQDEVGKYATVFPDGIKNEKDLIEAIKSGNVYPVVYKNGQYEKLIDVEKRCVNW